MSAVIPLDQRLRCRRDDPAVRRLLLRFALVARRDVAFVVLRCLAAVRACRDNAERDAPERPSRFSARVVARDRVRDVFPVRFLLLFRAEALPFGGGGSLTPAFRAFDKPMAIACFGFRTPCFPSRT